MIHLPHRSILRVSGVDRKTFLQGLITNDIARLKPETPLYAALLNPQGKILFDFLLFEKGEDILLDCWREKTTALRQRLAMYKLRAKISIEENPELHVFANPAPQGPNPESGIYPDPRHPRLGMRMLTDTLTAPAREAHEYDTHRIALGIPESQDFIDERSFPMEFGLSDLHAISYTKGCYVGQEIIARARSRGTLNKALHQLLSQDGGALPVPGTPVTAGDMEIGQMRSSAGTTGLAVLRLDGVRNAAALSAGGTPVTAALPDWFSLLTPVMQAP